MRRDVDDASRFAGLNVVLTGSRHTLNVRLLVPLSEGTRPRRRLKVADLERILQLLRKVLWRTH